MEVAGAIVKIVYPAYVSEGSTDDRFLTNVLDRAVNDVCLRQFSDLVDVAPAIVVRNRSGPAPILDSVTELKKNAGGYNIVFYHHDAGANLERVNREWVEPMRTAWVDSGLGLPLVFVVPVRETEAWALADGDAIRRVYGVSWDNARLGVPDDPRDVAGIEDPKKVLTAIGKETGGRVRDHHSRLGELVSLDRLGAVDAFATWRNDLTHALEHDIRLTRQGRR